MNLEALGFDQFFSEQQDLLNRPDLAPARIGLVGRSSYRLAGCQAEQGELCGKLLYGLEPLDFPAVGDWVAVADLPSHTIIHHVFKRRTALLRREPGTSSGRQIIAANVDVFFIVTSANRDFNERRMERYRAMVWESGAKPVFVLNKIDLAGNIDAMAASLDAIAFGSPVVRVSATTGHGMDDLRAHIGFGKTIGLIGSSGVGKSSLANRLLGREALATNSLRNDGKGRHTTTHRELIVLPDGGILIDTPGMRELGMVEDTGGIEAGFADIAAFAKNCRYSDCQHNGEPGCAVAGAIDSGELEPVRLQSYHKLQREIAAMERLQDPACSGRSKKHWKSLSKTIRAFSKIDPKRHD